MELSPDCVHVRIAGSVINIISFWDKCDDSLLLLVTCNGRADPISYRYLVASSISDEAKKRPGCHLEGFVGRLREFDEDKPNLFRCENTHFFWIRDPVCFEMDQEENNETDIYNSEDKNLEKGLNIRFKMSISQRLDIQSSAMESISQPNPNALAELEPPKVDFCFSVRGETGGQGSDSTSSSKRSTITERTNGEPRELHTTEIRAQRRLQPHIEQAPTEWRRGMWTEKNIHEPKVAMQNEAIVFVPDSPRIERTVVSLAKLPNYHVKVYAASTYPATNQDDVQFESLGLKATHIGSALYAACIISLIPLAIIGGLSGFKPQSATLAQETWTMTWLVSGGVVGVWGMSFWGWLNCDLDAGLGRTDLIHFFIGSLIFMLIFAVPTIGGFVVVGQMLVAYGSCYRFT